jgi:methylaspartate ammonia-lyase
MSAITEIISVSGAGGYYVEDLDALQQNPLPPEERYTARPISPGFQAVREPAQIVSVGLVLDSGQTAWGDCAGVAYSGKAGRYPVFRAEHGQEIIQRLVAPLLRGKPVEHFRPLADQVDQLTETATLERALPERESGEDLTRRELFQSAARAFQQSQPKVQETVTRPIHPAVRYGVTQALLQAAALHHQVNPVEIICREWDLPLPEHRVPLHGQCGSSRFRGALKMIHRRLDSLPHALVDDIPNQLGSEAVQLVRYVRWLKKQIQDLDDPAYTPTLHLDVHGGLGRIFEDDLGRILGALYSLEKAADPLPVRVESPLIMDSLEEQLETMKTLREYVDFRDLNLQLVADEWANSLPDIEAFLEARAAHMLQIKMPDLGGIQNSVEAVLRCREEDLGAFLGGSCAETDLSARLSVHIALAARPDLLLIKPGMGLDEGYSLIRNEMNRTLAVLRNQS